MKVRRVLGLFAVVMVAGLLAVGCGQSEEQAETSSRSASGDGALVTCQGEDGDMTCAVTCSGAEGKSEYTFTCEGHEGAGECTVTCEHDGENMTCTATCDGEKATNVACDGKTVTCTRADGTTCTCEHPSVSEGGCAMKTADNTGSCPMSSGGTCPGASASKKIEESGS